MKSEETKKNAIDQDPQKSSDDAQEIVELEEEDLEDLPEEEDEINQLELDLEQSKAKAEEYLDGWQRSMAEFSNYKKRINRERQEYQLRARGEVILHFLELADDLERALEDKPEKGEGASWAEGIEIIYRKLMTKLEADGIKPMNAKGKMFDPNIHEALMQEETDDSESGKIIEVVQEGYWIGEKVLRPALVRIAA
jgi:molecular chaperone GrpE